MSVGEPLSLIDLANCKTAEWWVVYFDRDPPEIFPQRWLKRGFRHIELCQRVSLGTRPDEAVWLLLMPTSEMLQVALQVDPRPPWHRYPGLAVQKVTTVRPYYWLRSRFELGPQSCVEVAKAALGIRSFWVRTPYQLYKYIRKRNGIV